MGIVVLLYDETYLNYREKISTIRNIYLSTKNDKKDPAMPCAAEF